MSSRRVSIVESNSISTSAGEVLHERLALPWHTDSMSIAELTRFGGWLIELSEMIRSSNARNPIDRAVSLIDEEPHTLVPL